MRTAWSARVLVVVATSVWVAMAIAVWIVAEGRWRAPSGGLPDGGWRWLAGLTATATVLTAWACLRRYPQAGRGLALAWLAWVLPVASGLAAAPYWLTSFVLALPPLVVAGFVEVGTGVEPKVSDRVRRLRGATWLACGLSSLVLLLTYDPFGDVSCRRTCVSLPVLLEAVGTTLGMRGVGVLMVIATVSGVLAIALVRRSPPSVVSSIAVAILGSATVWVHVEPRDADARAALEAVTGLTLLAVAGTVAARVAVDEARLRSVERLARGLAEGVMTEGVEFAVGHPPKWVDAQGLPSTLDANVRPTEVGDERGPVVRWLPGAGPGPRSSSPDRLHAATWLALDNARRTASTRHRLVELRAAQRRIVATADAERLRIGRDLHDQTQQRIVGASLHLRLAAGRADPDVATPLLDAERRLRPVLAALRTISHGPFPEVLAEEGLATALGEWAADADVRALTFPTDLGHLPGDVERAAYAAVVAVADTPDARVTVTRNAGDLVVEVTQPGAKTYDLTAVSDRVGAAGGTLTERASSEGWTTIEVVLPCES